MGRLTPSAINSGDVISQHCNVNAESHCPWVSNHFLSVCGVYSISGNALTSEQKIDSNWSICEGYKWKVCCVVNFRKVSGIFREKIELWIKSCIFWLNSIFLPKIFAFEFGGIDGGIWYVWYYAYLGLRTRTSQIVPSLTQASMIPAALNHNAAAPTPWNSRGSIRMKNLEQAWNNLHTSWIYKFWCIASKKNRSILSREYNSINCMELISRLMWCWK